MNYGIFSKSRGVWALGGMLSKREPPVTRLAQNGWGVGEVGDALGKGGRTLLAHLACLRGAQSGWGRSDCCPSAPRACAQLGGDAGVLEVKPLGSADRKIR